MPRLARIVPALLLAVPIATLFLARPGQGLPLYAARTGNLCIQCHFDPNGGGPRKDYGFMFARNRHSIEPDTSGMWKDLDLTNRVGEKMPLYFSVNQRFMLFANGTAGGPQGGRLGAAAPDRVGFFGMENALYLAFQPHPRLTLVYGRDAFADGAAAGVQEKDAFGMISGFPWDGYIKIGRFRNPFGLRMDDHTVATRNSFLDFASGERFLPYDPRYPDMGVEIGGQSGMFYGRAAFTNGPADVFSQNPFAETKSIKVGVNRPYYQSGLSFYDDYVRETAARNTRWGYYGLTHRGPLAVIGEVDAGTDVAPGPGAQPKTNLLAWFAETDWAAGRSVNFRLRYDFLDMNRSSDALVRDTNSHQRLSLESEWVPVPFAELRFAARRIDHKNAELYGSPDESQFFVQAHFSY